MDRPDKETFQWFFEQEFLNSKGKDELIRLLGEKTR
jgi:hypothetical protein